jgi:16S rRNA (guanine527-N7)-methyltransferase
VYRTHLHKYASALDLMSPTGLSRLDEHLDDAQAYVRALVALNKPSAYVLDVGSGAGLPGLVIAAMLDEAHVELVERRKKRATFLRGAVAAMKLQNVTVVGADVTATRGPAADVVTAQAVARFADVHAWTAHRQCDPVVLISRKGPEGEAEIDELASRTGQNPSLLVREALANRGTLLAVQAAGGQPCPSSASSTKKGA